MTVLRRNFSNTAAVTSLSGAINATQTSISVTDATGYPSAPFSIRCELEVMNVTAKSGTTFTVERGYDGTVGLSHADGIQITHVAIADDFRNKLIDPLVVEDTITIYDDEFDGESTAPWSAVTPSGSATWSEKYGVLSTSFSNQTTNHVAGYVTSINGLSYPLYIVTAARLMTPDLNYARFGPLFSNGAATASPITWNSLMFDTADPWQYDFQHLTGEFRLLATTHFTTTVINTAGWVWQRLDWISTNNYRSWLSPDGVTWSAMGQTAHTPALTPTHYGFGVSTHGGTATPARIATFQFFRVYTVKPTWWQEV